MPDFASFSSDFSNFVSPVDLEISFRANAKLRQMCHSLMKELDACITDRLLSSFDYDFYRNFSCALITMLVSGESEFLEDSEDAEE